MEALTEFKAKLFSEAVKAGFSDCEIYYRSGKTFESHIFKSEVRDYKNSSFSGLSFRGCFNGKMGYAYTERIDPDVIDVLINNAAGNAGVIEDAEHLYPGDKTYPETNTYFESLNEVSQYEKIEAAKAMERAALDYDPRIKAVIYCVVGTGEDEVYIANTYGLELSHWRNFALAYVYPQAETKLAGEIWYGNRWEDFSPKALAEAAARKVISYLHAAPIKSGRYKVILSNETAKDLLSVYAGVFFAENVQKGFSLLKDKLNSHVASKAVTIRDDGVCRRSMGSLPFDAEGVSTKNKTVIENGVLKTYLYTTKSAERDRTQSTGNGFKNGIQGAITTACTNFYILPSGRSKEDLLMEMHNGLLITELDGLHAGTNTVSGDFSLSASGFLVEADEIKRPVEQITIAGNFYQLLKDITSVAQDLLFDMPGRMGTVGSPSLLIDGLDVSGA